MVESVCKTETRGQSFFEKKSLIGVYVLACCKHLGISLKFMDIAELYENCPKHRIEPEEAYRGLNNENIYVMATSDVCQLMFYHQSLGISGHYFRKIDRCHERKRRIYIGRTIHIQPSEPIFTRFMSEKQDTANAVHKVYKQHCRHKYIDSSQYIAQRHRRQTF